MYKKAGPSAQYPAFRIITNLGDLFKFHHYSTNKVLFLKEFDGTPLTEMLSMPGQKSSFAHTIQNIKLFLLDLDGTVYCGNALIPGAHQFIATLARRGIPYVFLTNNSSRSAASYVKKINRLGIPATLDSIFTSGQATGIYCTKQKRGARVFVLGTRSLCTELEGFGCILEKKPSTVDYVVAGYDTELTYKKITTACELIDRGAAFIATNPDFVCPIEDRRWLPDCGAICEMITHATGKRPTFIGKPAPEMVTLMRKKYHVTKKETAVIGDRLYTDIASGINAGVFTICVLTGEATRASIRKSTHTPDLIINSIDEVNRYLV